MPANEERCTPIFGSSAPSCSRRSAQARAARLPTREHERALNAAGARVVAGIDEVGRGPLAGPVVAAAVVLPAADPPWLGALRDSKRLTPRQRESIAAAIRRDAAFGVGVASAAEIDALGIVPATRLAVRRALALVAPAADALLLDAFPLPDSPLPQMAVVHGDALCSAVAAASIVAKVARDRIMAGLAVRWPGYGFDHNRGYGTPAHLDALARLGPCPVHRLSFAPLRSPNGADGDAAARRRPHARRQPRPEG